MTAVLISDRVSVLAGPRILGVLPDAALVTVDLTGTLSGNAPTVDVVFLSPDLVDIGRASATAHASLLGALRSSRLKWVQVSTAGVDGPLFAELFDRGVRTSNAPGIHAEPIAEYVLAQILAINKRIAEHSVLEAGANYTPLDADDLAGQTLGIVGYGGIGRATARLARAFGMKIFALRRTLEPDSLVDEMFSPDRLDDLLAASDVVLVALPLTAATHRLINRDRLHKLRERAILINVGRGDVVDEAALAETLSRKRIRAAVLDVQIDEPLPRTSPLWRLERCIITAHDSSRSPRTLGRAIDVFLDNLGRYARGEPLQHEVTAELISR
jgi:phosphoglycerate dehydrogenase-like enzyme